jgi:hypothetical protein
MVCVLTEYELAIIMDINIDKITKLILIFIHHRMNLALFNRCGTVVEPDRTVPLEENDLDGTLVFLS